MGFEMSESPAPAEIPAEPSARSDQSLPQLPLIGVLVAILAVALVILGYQVFSI